MPIRRLVAAITAVLLLALAPASFAASEDSLAPADAPPHWLPPEPWVYNHWIPFDEGRLYSLLHVTRSQVWQQLRDDRHSLADLAARNGRRDPERLAEALVAPWRGRVGAARLRTLQDRALRTLTQGHLSQHLLFHSLHQFAIPSAAPEIFGISDAAFRDQRRTLELSPLAIGRLHGRSPARVEALCAAVLRDRVEAGVRGRAMTAAQGRLLLRRQLSQLPRWLNQARYNGPPKTHRGKLVAKPRDYASNPTLAAGGSSVVYERYRQKLPRALQLGEIAVVSHALDGGRGRLVSRPATPAAGGATRPTSAYNATVSGDGRWVAYESSAGNRNFAKRYGRIAVLLTDTATGTTTAVPRPTREARLSQSLYNPVLAADGSALAFQGVDRGGAARVFVRPVPSGRTVLASAGLPAAPAGATVSVYEPTLSGDGRLAAFTVVTTDAAGQGGTSSRVMVRDLRAGTTVAITDPARFASGPALSGDGRTLAYTAADRAGGAPRLVVRDLAPGDEREITGAGDGAVLEPQLSADATKVVAAEVLGGRSRIVWRDLATGARRVVSDGFATGPSLSADGLRVAYASDATPNGTRGIFVADAATGRRTLVSGAAGAGAPAPTAAAAASLDLPAAAGATTAPTVSIIDNAFTRAGRRRPSLSVARGTTVSWAWRSQSSHNVTVRSGPVRFASPTRAGGATFRRRLTRAGIYDVVCTLHSPGMRMTVRVR